MSDTLIEEDRYSSNFTCKDPKKLPCYPIHYLKMKPIQLKEFSYPHESIISSEESCKTSSEESPEKSFKTLADSIQNLQSYVPIYQQFFKLNELNYNNIALNHRYHIKDQTHVTDPFIDPNIQERSGRTKFGRISNNIPENDVGVCRNITVERDVFIKFSPLLDPIRYMSGKYDLNDPITKNLPKYDSSETDTHPKILSPTNASYVDGFFYYLSSVVKNHHNFVHGIDFYGSHLGIQDRFKMNIEDDLDYLSNSQFFLANLGKLMVLDNCPPNALPLLHTGSRGVHPSLSISEEDCSADMDLDAVRVDCVDSLAKPLQTPPGSVTVDQEGRASPGSPGLLLDPPSSSMNGGLVVLSGNPKALCPLGDQRSLCGRATLAEDIASSPTVPCSTVLRTSALGSDMIEINQPSLPSNIEFVSETIKNQTEHPAIVDPILDIMQENGSDSKSDSGSDSKSDSGSEDDSENSHVSNTSSEKEDDDEDWETEDEDDQEDDQEEEKEATAYIFDYPVQMIFLEKCKNTLDDLFMKDLPDNEACSALFQIVMILLVYQKMFKFTHNDLHTNNIMYIETTEPFLWYRYQQKVYKIPTYGRIFKIIDYGRSIYKYREQIFCSDSFAPGGDAATQYNCEPYFKSTKPRLEPNMGFDLCRLGCSIFDFVFGDSEPESEPTSDLQRTIQRWCRDDEGKNVMYKKNGSERYPGFKLYKMIARTSHHHTPEAQLQDQWFRQFMLKDQEQEPCVQGAASLQPKNSGGQILDEFDIMDIDMYPEYYSS